MTEEECLKLHEDIRQAGRILREAIVTIAKHWPSGTPIREHALEAFIAVETLEGDTYSYAHGIHPRPERSENTDSP